ncbi:MAG: hypothetical protein FWG88_04175 [Oscillospiraceae bacterium]|nr:hypothetical protein [Oscillospiraceae bacterium]
MKKKIFIILAAAVFLSIFSQLAIGSESLNARPTVSTVSVNGENIEFEAYYISENNYFKLRDLAYTLSGTQKQFNVTWDGQRQAISLTSNTAYVVEGGEMTGSATVTKSANLTSSSVFLNGVRVELTAYHIDGNNFFRLRDIGLLLDFSVVFIPSDNMVIIDTSRGYNDNSSSQTEGSPWTQASHTASDVTTLKNKSVYFAHNSVGQNILDGIKAIDSSISISNNSAANSNGITENYMGFNGDPNGKLDAFTALVRDGGGDAQIVVFKLCYADFQAHTDVDKLFDDYVAVYDALQKEYPDTIFVHITAPLYHYNASYNNRVQHAFNEKLRNKYGALVFDLAAIEAIDSSGNPVLSRDGVSPALAEEWTSDGSHLNTAGSRRLASALIAFLAQL